MTMHCTMTKHKGVALAQRGLILEKKLKLLVHAHRNWHQTLKWPAWHIQNSTSHRSTYMHTQIARLSLRTHRYLIVIRIRRIHTRFENSRKTFNLSRSPSNGYVTTSLLDFMWIAPQIIAACDCQSFYSHFTSENWLQLDLNAKINAMKKR